jgi:hypothetical protein
VAKIQYFRRAPTNQNYFKEETMCRLNLGAACYHAVHNLLPSAIQKLKD